MKWEFLAVFFHPGTHPFPSCLRPGSNLRFFLNFSSKLDNPSAKYTFKKFPNFLKVECELLISIGPRKLLQVSPVVSTHALSCWSTQGEVQGVVPKSQMVGPQKFCTVPMEYGSFSLWGCGVNMGETYMGDMPKNVSNPIKDKNYELTS